MGLLDDDSENKSITKKKKKPIKGSKKGIEKRERNGEMFVKIETFCYGWEKDSIF